MPIRTIAGLFAAILCTLALAHASTVTVTPNDRIMGSVLAPVTVVEYASPSCPHCAHFNADIFPLLKRGYIERGKVLYVFRVFPRQPVDGAAEGLARCLPPKQYFAAMDLLFRNQNVWDPALGVADPRAGLESIAGHLGLDAKRADACMSDQTVAQRTNAEAADAVAHYGIRGTPTFVINGIVQPAGVIPWPQMQQIIDRLAP